MWWFKENEIEKLLKIENDKGIKIFPRYYHRCTLIEDVDRFCLNYGLFNKSLDDLKNIAKANLDKLEKYAVYHGIDFDELLDENQDIMNPGIIENIQTDYQIRNDTAILNLPGDFLNILLADPNPWDFEGQIDRLCKGFWKTKNPFTTANLPLSLNNFGSHKFKKMAESEWLQQAKSDILPEFTKSHVQTYLMQNYAYFIREYVEIIKDKSFSYADFWSLKEKYLKELHRLLQKQAQLQSENRFYRDDAYWIVSFNDDEKRYGDLKGLSYIHHLIKNIGMKISYFELNDLFNTEPPKSEDEIAQGSDEDLSEGYEFGQKRQRLIDYEGLQKIRNAKNIIKKMMDDAESNGDREKYLRMKDEYLKVDKATGSYFFKGGGIRSFDDPIDAKRAKDKIDRDIKYALNKIETNDEKAFNHFKKSIRKEEGTISYDPDKMIDWYTG